MFKAVKWTLLKFYPDCFDEDSEEIWEEREYGFYLGVTCMGIWYLFWILVGICKANRS